MKNLDHDGILYKDPCCSEWDERFATFEYYFMSECVMSYQIIMLINQREDSKMSSIRDEIFASFCCNILKDMARVQNIIK